MAKPEREMTGFFWQSGTYTLVAGARSYELSNHLGNVLAVVSDRGELQSAQDYFPFGMAMPGRSDGAYRYGFNGKETDPETGIQDYGMRWYLPNIARFPSVDPITAQYPELTPYQFAGNMPIAAIDLDGLEPFGAHYSNGVNISRPVTQVTNNKVVLKEAAINAMNCLLGASLSVSNTSEIFTERVGTKNKKGVFMDISYRITTYTSPLVVIQNQTVINIESDADIDHDGGRHAYTRDNKPRNGIMPKDKIANIAEESIIGEYPDGFLKTATSFKDENGDSMDAETVPYVALPSVMMKDMKDGNKWGIKPGDLVYMFNPAKGIGLYGIVADASGKQMGEISDFANQKLQPGDGKIEYFILPGTSTNKVSDLTSERIQERGKAAFNPNQSTRDREILNSALNQTQN